MARELWQDHFRGLTSHGYTVHRFAVEECGSGSPSVEQGTDEFR